MVSYKLTYFNVYGRGETIRLLFVLTNKKFEEVRLSFAEWPAVKFSDNAPNPLFGTLPVLDVVENDGSCLKIAQSLVIARYLANKFNLNGESQREKLEVEMYMEHADDLLRAGGGIPFISNPEIRQKKTQAFVKRNLPASLDSFEKRLEQTETGFLVGRKLTVADLSFVTAMDHHFLNIEGQLFVDHHKCKGLYDRIKNIPEIAKWQKENPVRRPNELLQEAKNGSKL